MSEAGVDPAQSALLREALLARADAEAAQVRADDAREEAEEARSEAERARADADLGRARIAILAEAGRRMAESMDWEHTIKAVARSAVPAVADWTSLAVLEGGRLRVVAVAHSDRERERLAWQLVDRYPRAALAPTGAAKVVRTGELELVEDLSPDVVRGAARDPEHLVLLENLNVRHYAIAPLKTPSGVIGALTFVLGDSGRRFTAGDLELITSLAARAGLHIQNSRMYTERSHIAEVLQASLRPRALPALAGVEVAARFLPAGDQIEVGGDFYDVFLSGDGVWTAIVGDVTGKGPEAAAVTAIARHTLRTASLLDDRPAANLELLNRALLTDSRGPSQCTVFYARLCPGQGGVDCRFANAGHPAPLLLRGDARVEPVEQGRGPLIGAFGDAEYSESTLRLRPQELLLLYTDGVTEVRGREATFGESELYATLARCDGMTADEVLDAVLERAVEIQGGQPADDIALLAIKAGADGQGEP